MAIQYVGGMTGNRAGATSTLAVNYALTGGLCAMPCPNDLVIITVVIGTVGRTPTCAIATPTGFTSLTQVNANGTTNDCSINVSYKFMGSTPDTSFTLPSTGNVADGQSYTVQVFRDVDLTTPMDVAAVSTSGTGTSRPDPAAITPTTTGAIVVVCSGGAAGTGATFTYSGLNNVLTSNAVDTTDATVGSGWTTWTSGALNPAASTTGEAVAADSWGAFTLALRPATETAGGTNLLQYSEQWDNAVWSDGNTTPVTTNVSADPNAATTVDEATISSTNLYRRQLITGLTSGQKYTFSCWVQQGRTGTATNTRLTVNNTVAWDTGGSKQVALGSSLTRVYHTWTNQGTSAALMIGRADGSSGADATCDGTVRAWGFMLNTGNIPGTYAAHPAAGANTNSVANPATYSVVAQAAKDHIGSLASPATYAVTGEAATSIKGGGTLANISTLSDAFNSIDTTTKFVVTGTGTGQSVTAVTGKAVITVNGDLDPVGTSNYYGLESQASYTAVGGSIYGPVERLITDSNDWGYSETHFYLRNPIEDSALGFAICKVSGTTWELRARRWNSYSTEWQTELATLAYSTTNHFWLQLREASGTFYWEVAPDSSGVPGTWSTFHSATLASLVNGNLTSNFASEVKWGWNAGYWDNSMTAAYITTQSKLASLNTGTSSATNTDSVANPATYAVTAASATSGRGQFSNATPATYSVTGVAATSAVAPGSNAQPATYVVTAAAATSTVQRNSSANPSTYSVTANLGTSNFGSLATPATYSVTGVAATSTVTLFSSGTSQANAATYSVTGAATTDLIAAITKALPATYAVTGFAATSGKGYASIALPAAYTVTGAATTDVIALNRTSTALPATYSVTGFATTINRGHVSLATPASYLVSPVDTTVVTDGEQAGSTIIDTPVPPSVPLSDQEFLEWLSDPLAIRVVLFEVNALDSNGNTEQLFFANRGYTSRPYDLIGNQYYSPLLRGGLDFQEKMNLDLGGDLSYGDVELDNSEGDLDYLLMYSWQYQPAKAFIGDARWSRNNFRQIFDGTVEDVDTSGRDAINIKLRDKLFRLDMPLHDQKIGGASAESDALLPVVFGECHNVTPVLLDAAALKYCYHVRRGEAVYEVRDNGIPVARSEDTGSSPATFHLTQQPFGRITCSVQGDMTVEKGYQNTVVGIVYRLVTEWGTEPDKRFVDNDIDLVNFNSFYADNQQKMGMQVTERMTVLEACQAIAASIGARIVMTAQGKMQLVQINVPPVGTPIEVGPSDMIQGSLRVVDRPRLMPSVKIGYAKNWTVQEDTADGLPEDHKKLFAREWLTVTLVNDVVRTKYQLWSEPEQEDTFLIRASDAGNETARRLRLRSEQRLVYEFRGFADLILTPVGASMRLTHPRFGLENGKIGQVVGVSVDWTTAQVTIQVVA